MRPLVLPLLGFITGLLIYSSLEAPPSLIATVAFFFLSLPIFALPGLLKLQDKTKRISMSLAAFTAFFFLGSIFILPVAHPKISSKHIVNNISSEDGALGMRIEGVLKSAPERKGPVTHLYVDTQKRLKRDGSEEAITGRIRLTVKGFKGGLLPGDRIIFLAKLTEPRNLNNPGGFDYEWWLKRRGVLVTGYVKDGSLIIKTADGGFSLVRVSSLLREEIIEFLDRLDLENGGIIKALTSGDRGDIDGDLVESFRRAGASHILAISGLHVGIVALFSYTFLNLIFRRSQWLMLRLSVKKLSLALSLLPVFFYGCVSGFSVSTERAVIMALAVVFALLLSRGKDFYNTIALAALTVLIIEPGSLWEAGFQLSFAVLLGIVYFMPKLKAIFEGKDALGLKPIYTRRKVVVDRIKGLVFVSIAASVATAPIAALHFNRVSLLSVASSLVVVPLLGFIVVPVSLIGFLLSLVSVYIGGTVFKVIDPLVTITVYITELLSRLPFGSFYVETPLLIEIAGFYLFVVIIGRVMVSGWELRRGSLYGYALPVAVVATAAGVFFFPRYLHSSGVSEGELRVTFISVGQGDAAFVEFPGGETMLIDGGGGFGRDFDMGRVAIAPFFWDKRVRKIDYMLLSHAQRDHKEGLSFMVENFAVGEFWWNGLGRLGDLGEILKTRGVRSLLVDASTEAKVIGGVRVEFLNPTPPKTPLTLDPIKGSSSSGRPLPDINESSVVIKLSYGEKSFLFTGDIGEEAEEGIIESLKKGGKRFNNALRADILKAPHHGSRFSSSSVFLEEVSPEYVVVSAGYRNYFGFPHQETLDRYRGIKATILRTDLSGAITVTTDGEKLSLSTYLPGAGRGALEEVFDIKRDIGSRKD